jgi:hypothetical protein
VHVPRRLGEPSKQGNIQKLRRQGIVQQMLLAAFGHDIPTGLFPLVLVGNL